MSATYSRTGVALTAAAGVVGAVPTLVSGVWLGAVALPLAVGGVHEGSRRLLGTGVATLFGSVVVASFIGTPLVALVPAMVGTVVLWDVGENAISVSEQVGAAGVAWRGQLLHAAVSTAVVAGFATAVTLVYRVSTGGYPLLAVTLLVVGAVIVLVGLGR